MRTSISLPSIHALFNFDPTVLEGRDIVPYVYQYGKRSIDFEDELIMEGESNRPGAKMYAHGGGFILAGSGPDGIKDRYYDDVIWVRSEDGSGKAVPFAKKGDHGKLVTTKDEQVYGVVVAIGKNKNKESVTVLVPAQHLVEPPAEHIREYLKGKFDPAVLQGRKLVADVWRYDEYVAIEGKSENPRSLEYDFEINIDGIFYTRALVVCSYCDSDNSDQGLQDAIENGLFSAPTDVGKLVVARGDISKTFSHSNPAVVGCVAAMETKYVADPSAFTGWCQRTYICPAYDLTIP
jgi:hypothetical protein